MRWQNGGVAKLLGIDVGTTSTKAILIDEHGRVLDSHSVSYPIARPLPGWSEQDPEDWARAAHECVERLEGLGVDAIGLTGQMHGATVLDLDGKVLRPAILWNDQRTAEESAEIERLVGRQRVMDITCNPPLTGFQAPKLLWMRRHEPEKFKKIAHVLLPKDFVRFRLTDCLSTDCSDASGTALFDVHKRRWSEDILGELEIPANWLPSVGESWEIESKTHSGIPVVRGAGDQAAAAVGTGAVVGGLASISLGTSGVVFASQDTPDHDPDGRTHTFCHANGTWHSMGVTLACGGAVQWLKDTFYADSSFNAMEQESAASSVGANGVTFLPYLGGERCPKNDPYLRAHFGGMSSSTQRGDLARAVFEGTAFGLRDALEVIEALCGVPNIIRVTGGGAKSDLWLQIVADVLGHRIELTECDEGPALGAALLAGTGIGIWPDVRTACESTVRIRRSIEPSGSSYEEAFHWYQELGSAVKDWGPGHARGG